MGEAAATIARCKSIIPLKSGLRAPIRDGRSLEVALGGIDLEGFDA